MRPKNRVFCARIGRLKMLFATKKKAENFINFNGGEIKEENGYAPIRVYYCQCCGGYHLTSKQLKSEVIVKES